MKKSLQKFLANIISIEKSSGSKPFSLWNSANPLLDETTIGKIIDTYRGHPSVTAIKSLVSRNSKFNLAHATTQDVNKIIHVKFKC